MEGPPTNGSDYTVAFYQLRAAPAAFSTSDTGHCVHTKSPEQVNRVHEGDEPQMLLTEIHLPVPKADATARGHRAGPVVQRVVEFAEADIGTM